MNQLRVVIDTNVLVSAMLFHQSSVTWLRHAWQSDVIRLLASRQTIEELIRVLAYPKFHLTDAEREDLLGDYLPWCETISVPKEIEIPDCRDPFDRPFLALTLAANADALVTGDMDLLELTDSFKALILTPTALEKHLNKITETGKGK